MINQPRAMACLQRRWHTCLLLAFSGGGIFFLASGAQAQNAGLDTLAQANVNLGNQPLIETVARIINIGLGVLGVIAVGLILYAGFVWLTSQGNEEKISRAKKILSGAAIGLVIILASYALASFIVSRLLEATGGRESGGPIICADGSPPPCFGFNRLQVTSTSPRHQEEGVKLCKRVQAQFNEKLDPGTIKASTVRLFDTKNTPDLGDDELVPGTFVVNEKAFSFRHPDFARERRYRAQINSGASGVKDIQNRSLREDKKWYFTTGSETDAVLPQVVSVYPTAGSTETCRQTPIQVKFSEELDVTTLNKQNIILQDASGSIVPLADIDVGSNFNEVTVYAASQLSSHMTYTVILKSGPSGIADTCGNPLDGNKNGTVDGTPADDYAWSFTTGETVDCKPTLETLTPDSGYYGEVLTLTGKNLALLGEVLFNDWPADSHSLDIPPTDNIICWGAGDCPANTIKVKVPVGFLLGNTPAVAIKVKVGREQSASQTFTLLSPAISALNPNHGPSGQFVTIFGLNFGAIPGSVNFGEAAAELACVSSSSWTDREIVVKVPAGLPLGEYEVQVITGGNLPTGQRPSNQKDFTVDNSPLAPGLCAIRPQCAAQAGANIDEIEGARFGSNRGASVVNLAGYNIVPQGAWSDSLIKDVAVPASLGNDNHLVRVIVNNQASNAKYYDIPCLATSYPRVIENSQCEFYTQSPSPYKNTTAVCGAALLSARFSEAMDSTTLQAANIILKQCGSADEFKESDCSQDITLGNFSYLRDSDNNDIGFYVAPPTLLANNWYLATIKKTVTSQAGAPMLQDYTWHWRVKADTSACAINKVMCTPSPAFIRTLTPPDNGQVYTGAATAANCNLLNTSSYTWDWSSSDVTKATLEVGEPTSQALATAWNWTSPTAPVKVTARLPSENKAGQCDLFISPTACRESKDCQVCGAGVSSCVAGNCTPAVTNFSPEAGAPGTWLTINGCYFGESAGQVIYQKSGGGEVEGLWPAPDVCGSTWSNRQIISELPPGAGTGKFTVVRPPANAGSGVSPISFTVDNVNYPGLCQIEPKFIYEAQLGTSAAQVELKGKGFTEARAGSDAVKYYKPDSVTLSKTATDYPAWTNQAIKAITPSGTAVGLDKVAVFKNDVLSNKINLRLYPGSPPPEQPVVSSISPDNGKADSIATTFITIKGDKFGLNQASGRVLLKAVAPTDDWQETTKDYDFNSDKTLTQADVSLLISKKGAVISQGDKEKNRKFDVNNDGKVDDNDETIVADYLALHPRQYDAGYTIEADTGCGWSNNEIVAKLPPTLVLGEQWRVIVKTSGGKSVNQNAIFTVSNIIHPGICTITPNHGKAGTQVSISGINFGDVKSSSQATFSKVGAVVAVADKYIKSWRNTAITLVVPETDTCGKIDVCPVKIITGPVKVAVNFPLAYGGKQESNPVIFYAEPYITSITPGQGPPGSWLTIKGGNFGKCSSRGTSLSAACVVTFAGAGESRVLEDSLPATCGNTWSDSEIVAKAPAGGVTGLVKVRSEFNQETGLEASKLFTYNPALPLAPGLCKLEPDSASQLPQTVTLKGDGFGHNPGAADNIQFSNKNFTKDGKPLDKDNQPTNPTWLSWSNNAISLNAPSGTISGDVFVRRQQRLSVGTKCNGVMVGGKCLGVEETIYQDIMTASNPREFKIEEKPKVTKVAPSNGAANVCRNVPIVVTFDRSLGSVSPLTADQFKVRTYCYNPVFSPRDGLAVSEQSIWQKLRQRLFFWLSPVSEMWAAQLCRPTTVDGVLSVSVDKLIFKPDQPFRANTVYEVQLDESKLDCGTFCSWQFTTQDKICQIDKVELSPSRHTFTKIGLEGEKEFTARAVSSEGQELAVNYAWSKTDKDNLVDLGNPLTAPSLKVTAKAKNGWAILQVEADGRSLQAGKSVGTADLEVFICDFPWEFSDGEENMRLRYCRGNLADIKFGQMQLLNNPDFENELQDWSNTGQWQTATFKQQGARSAANTTGAGELSQTVKVTPGYDYLLTGYIYYSGAIKIGLGSNEQAFSGSSGAWQKITILTKAVTGNLTLKFTAQAGSVYVDSLSLREVAGLLPGLSQPAPPFTRNQGDLLREYFFKVDGSSDVFGLRVYKNFARLSPLDWYNSRTDINKGSPKKIADIDGYEAIQDGSAYYVSAVKQTGTAMYTNMYVLSFNQGAMPTTSQLASKLLDGWRFNTNISQPIKLAGLKRDLKRVQDLELLKKLVRAYQADKGSYPSLSAGTFKVGQTTSVWPSWQATLGNDLGRALPTDPLNNFADQNGDNLCRGAGYEGYDPTTCWNSSIKDFKCPSGSHIYQYQAGANHTLSLNFEYKGVIWPGSGREDINTGSPLDNSCQSFKYNFDNQTAN